MAEEKIGEITGKMMDLLGVWKVSCQARLPEFGKEVQLYFITSTGRSRMLPCTIFFVKRSLFAPFSNAERDRCKITPFATVPSLYRKNF